MARLVLAVLIALSLLGLPAAASVMGAAGPGDCTVPHGAATHAHHDAPQPARDGPPAFLTLHCCPVILLASPVGALEAADRGDVSGGEALPRDDSATGRVVEPAERPPRSPFLPYA